MRRPLHDHRVNRTSGTYRMGRAGSRQWGVAPSDTPRTGPAELGAFGGEEADAALRADIRRLGTLLGQTLAAAGFAEDDRETVLRAVEARRPLIVA